MKSLADYAKELLFINEGFFQAKDYSHRGDYKYVKKLFQYLLGEIEDLTLNVCTLEHMSNKSAKVARETTENSITLTSDDFNKWLSERINDYSFCILCHTHPKYEKTTFDKSIFDTVKKNNGRAYWIILLACSISRKLVEYVSNLSSNVAFPIAKSIAYCSTYPDSAVAIIIVDKYIPTCIMNLIRLP